MINSLSLCTTPINLLTSDGSRCGRATGFFLKRTEAHAIFLTNWHALTGRNAQKPTQLPHGYKVPTHMEIMFHARIEGEKGIRLSQKRALTIEINSPDGNQPLWLEHPDHNYKADIALIKFDMRLIDNLITFNTLQDCDLTNEYKESVMDDVFVIGYPWGLDGGNRLLPLYKRGSIASEPAIPQHGLPRILIDCRTAQGMSGAPVICVHKGFWSASGKPDDQAIIGSVYKFIGVYSGRLYDMSGAHEPSPQATEIGIVWNSLAVEELISKGVKGTKFDDL